MSPFWNSFRVHFGACFGSVLGQFGSVLQPNTKIDNLFESPLTSPFKLQRVNTLLSHRQAERLSINRIHIVIHIGVTPYAIPKMTRSVSLFLLLLVLLLSSLLSLEVVEVPRGFGGQVWSPYALAWIWLGFGWAALAVLAASALAGIWLWRQELRQGQRLRPPA